MLNSAVYRVTFLLSVLWLSGCASLPPESKHAHITPELLTQYQVHQATLQSFNHWQASGKLALIAQDARQSSRFNWQQTPTETGLLLTNMLGITVLEAKEEEDAAEIVVNGSTYTGYSLEALIAKLTGYLVPTQAISLWLTGYADLSKISDLALDTQGRLLHFKQSLNGWNDWQVSYHSYYPAQGNKPSLPAKLTLKHPEITIKLIVHQWNRS